MHFTFSSGMNVVFFQDLFEEVVQDLNSCLCINLHGFRRYVVKSCRFSISFCDNCSPDLCLCWYVVVDLQVVIARWYARGISVVGLFNSSPKNSTHFVNCFSVVMRVPGLACLSTGFIF